MQTALLQLQNGHSRNIGDASFGVLLSHIDLKFGGVIVVITQAVVSVIASTDVAAIFAIRSKVAIKE
jgi:hypothetical protein